MILELVKIKKGNPRANYAEVISIINKTKAKVITYDMSSGLDATTGQCLDPCINAQATLSLAMPKKVFDTEQGQYKSGQVYIADIGIPNFLYNKIKIIVDQILVSKVL